MEDENTKEEYIFNQLKIIASVWLNLFAVTNSFPLQIHPETETDW